MTVELEVQRASSFSPLPGDEQFQCWAQAALADRDETELTVRLVDRAESQALNARYRDKEGPTNVLSFAADLPGELGLPLLGDIVICAPLVAEEAEQQGKKPEHHWAHLTIHGILHLLGLDHLDDRQAAEMEALEIKLLDSLGIPNPYD